MRYVTVTEVLDLYDRVMNQSGGTAGVRDRAALESAVSQPRQTLHTQDSSYALVEKASALGFSLIKNHPFVDGSRRIGQAAMEVFLLLNGFEVDAPVYEQERVVLQVAAGEMDQQEFYEWLRDHVTEKTLD